MTTSALYTIYTIYVAVVCVVVVVLQTVVLKMERFSSGLLFSPQLLDQSKKAAALLAPPIGSRNSVLVLPPEQD